MRHINIPIFIPHLGCPNACVFCNQKKISGVNHFSLSDVETTIEEVLSTTTAEDDVEIAFFGGSFTAIDRSLMIQLLEIGNSYMQKGLVKSLRCSTRPDAINDEILKILRGYGMKTIELGMQSASDRVLSKTNRGHSYMQTVSSVQLIKKYGFQLVLQMMIGLPDATIEDEVRTAEQIAKLGADGARIYPTVVFYDTELCKMARRGEYTPLTNEEAVRRSLAVLRVLHQNNIRVIRIGLCSSDTLSSADEVYGGANHPALGELVYSELYYEKIVELLSESNGHAETVTIFVNKGELSRAIGHKKKNKMRLMEMFSLKDIRFVERSVPSTKMVSLTEEYSGEDERIIQCI